MKVARSSRKFPYARCEGKKRAARGPAKYQLFFSTTFNPFCSIIFNALCKSVSCSGHSIQRYIFPFSSCVKKLHSKPASRPNFSRNLTGITRRPKESKRRMCFVAIIREFFFYEASVSKIRLWTNRLGAYHSQGIFEHLSFSAHVSQSFCAKQNSAITASALNTSSVIQLLLSFYFYNYNTKIFFKSQKIPLIQQGEFYKFF